MMATELTVVFRFEDNQALPEREDLEEEFDCVVMEYETEEV